MWFMWRATAYSVLALWMKPPQSDNFLVFSGYKNLDSKDQDTEKAFFQTSLVLFVTSW